VGGREAEEVVVGAVGEEEGGPGGELGLAGGEVWLEGEEGGEVVVRVWSEGCWSLGGCVEGCGDVVGF